MSRPFPVTVVSTVPISFVLAMAVVVLQVKVHPVETGESTAS